MSALPPPRVPGDWAPAPLSPQHYVSPRSRLRFAQVGVVLAMVACGVSAAVSVVTAVVASHAIDLDPRGRGAALTGLDVPPAVVDQIVLVGTVGLSAAIGVLLCLVLAAVGVIRWQSRALRNLGGLAVPPPRLSPVAAGFAWFVPVWSLFGPKQAYNDLWRSGDVGAPAYLPVSAFRALPVPGFLTAWWGCWVSGNALGGASARVSVDTLGGLLGSSIIDLVVEVVLIVAGLLFLQTLRDISARQDARHAVLTWPPASGAGQTVNDSGTATDRWGPGPAAWTSP